MVVIVHPVCSRIADKSGEGYHFAPFSRQFGYHGTALPFFDRQLRGYFESAHGIYLLAEKVEPHGTVFRIRENIHDSASYGILPRLVDEIHALESELRKFLLDNLHRNAHADTQRQRPALQLAASRHCFGHGLGIGTDNRIAPLGLAEHIQHCRALHHGRGVFRAVYD